MVGGTAEIAQAPRLQRHRNPDVGARIKRLRFRDFILHPAAFDEANAHAGSDKFPCDRNAGGARADQTDIRLDRESLRMVPKIFDHARMRSSRWSTAQSRASVRARSQPSTTATWWRDQSRAVARKSREGIAPSPSSISSRDNSLRDRSSGISPRDIWPRGDEVPAHGKEARSVRSEPVAESLGIRTYSLRGHPARRSRRQRTGRRAPISHLGDRSLPALRDRDLGGRTRTRSSRFL